MDSEKYLDLKKEIQSFLLDYIENEDEEEENIQKIIKFINENNLEKNRAELKGFLQLLSNISTNHYRCKNFSTKIQQILLHIQDPIKQTFSDFDLFYIFRKDKKTLLFLFQQQIIKPNNYIIHQILEKNDRYYIHFFYPEIKPFLDIQKYQLIESQIPEQDPDEFESNRQKGENISPLCKLIRSDSVEEFIAYVTRNNIPLSSRINCSIFETNSFLLKNQPTIIEYSAFFGSIQIFQYLLMNHVTLKPSLWLYAIHGNNPELIHLIEYNKIELNDTTFSELIKESIKCHHNNVASYFVDNFLDESKKFVPFQEGIRFHNFFFIENDFSHDFVVNFFCKYDHLPLFESLVDSSADFSSLLIDAAKKNNCEIIQFLIAKFNIDLKPFLFKDIKKLSKISIPSNCTSISQSLFEGCTSLFDVEIPNSVKTIDISAFEGCTLLEKVTIPNSVKEIGEKAFCDCSSLKEIIIPSSVSLIGEKAFESCSSMTKVEIHSSSLLIIQKGTFSRCSSLKEINIPSSVKIIDLEAFYSCSSLIHLKIPSSVEIINDNAFEDCASLSDLKFPSSVSKIGENAFYHCCNLNKIDFECPCCLAEIGNNAFNSCSSLEKICIPPSLTIIGESAFKNCSSLKQISVPFDLNTVDIGIKNDVEVKRIFCTFI